MENSIAITGEATEKCAACYTNVIADDVYCANCGYPLKGSEFDQRSFIAGREATSLDLADYNKKIRSAGNSLYYLAGVFLLSAIVIFFTNQDAPEVLGNTLPVLILAILFVALGGYTSKKPLACIICGLSLYIIVQVLAIIGDPTIAFRGIIFKIVIIGYLIKGIKTALDLERFKKENNIA